MEDSNPAYESANAESNAGNQVTDRNPEYMDDENSESNNVDQLDNYDYMGSHDEYDYMGH